MNVIANACAVGSGVVIAKDRDLAALAEGDLQDDRNEVRLGLVALANVAVLVGTARVKVAEADVLDAVGNVDRL